MLTTKILPKKGDVVSGAGVITAVYMTPTFNKPPKATAFVRVGHPGEPYWVSFGGYTPENVAKWNTHTPQIPKKAGGIPKMKSRFTTSAQVQAEAVGGKEEV